MDETTTDKLVNIVQNYKANDQTGNGGWIAAAIAGIVALISIALLAWQAWQAGKARAKLLHEQAVAEETAHQEALNVDLAEADAERALAESRAQAAQDIAELLAGEIATLEETRQAAHAAINKISTWEDVDALVR